LKSYFIWLWLLFGLHLAKAQCDFNGILNIPDEGTTGLNLLINNAINNDLADPAQGVCRVLIKFKHDVIGDLNISLLSPSNQLVQLVGSGGTSSGFTDGALWDIKFTPCASAASPDPGFSPFWANDDFWQAFQQYNGTYYPHSGCLEDFNMGPVNGTWTLLIEDVAALDEGVIEYFSIDFCDDSGVDCSPCNPPAFSYLLDSLEICQGAVFDNNMLAFSSPIPLPDTINYQFINLIFGNSGYLGSTKDTLISMFDPGYFKICQLTYHKSDSIFVANLPLHFQDTVIDKILLEDGICGQVNDCISLTILPVGDTLLVNQSLCLGDTLYFQDLAFTQGGTYFVSDTSGKCDTIYQLSIDLQDLAPVITFSHPLLDCNHSEVGIHLGGIESSGNITILWSTNGGNIVSGGKSDSVVVNAKGFYQFEISNGNCVYYDSVFLDADLELPEVSLEPGTLNCDSINTLIHVNSSSILASVNWSGPMPFQQIGLDIRVSLPGWYVAEIVDQNGCSIVKTIEISQNVIQPRLQFDLFPITCTSAIGRIGVIDSFNIRTVLWSGPSPQNPTDIKSPLLLPGLYSLNLFGYNGCDTTLQINLPDERYEVDAILLPDTLTCSKKVVTLTVFSGRVIEDQLWQFPDMSSVNTINPLVMNPGNYHVTVTDNAGCTGNTNVEIGIDTLTPALLVTDRWIDCDSTQLRLKVDNAIPGFTYEWSGPNFFNSIDPSPVVNQEGRYVVTVTDQNGCSNTAVINVWLSTDLPDVSFLIDTLNCYNPVASLTPLDSTGIDFLWLSNGMLNTPNNFKGIVDTAGTYIVRITDRSNGCKRDYFLSVTDDRVLPDFNVVSDSLDCEKSKATLKIEGSIKAKTWSWSGEGFSSSDPMPQVSAPGWYKLEVTDSLNCMFIDSVFVIQADDIPDVGIMGTQLTCISNEAQLTAIAAPGVSFTWKSGNLTLGTGRSISVFSVGEYTVIGKGDGNCFDTASFEVFYDTLPPQLIPEPVLTLSCLRDSVELKVSANESLVSGIWEGPAVTGLDSANIWAKLPGIYYYTALDSAGCIANIELEVVDEAVYLSFDTLVNELNCKHPGMVELIFSEPPTQVIWTHSPIPIAEGTQSFQTNVAGIYSFELTNIQGCVTKGQLVVLADTVRPDISTLITKELNCIDTVITIGFLTPLPPGTTVSWEGGTIIQDTLQVNQAGSYEGMVTAANGCSSVFVAEVTQNMALPVFEALSDTINCIQSKTDIEISGTGTYTSVTWIGQSGDVYVGQKVKVDKPGYYYATVVGDNGCQSKDTVEVLSDFSIPELIMEDTFYLPCDGTGVMLEVNANKTILGYKWVGIDQTFFSTDPSPLITFPARIRVSASSTNGCEAHDTTLVILSPLRPSFGIKGDTIGCQPSTATLLAIGVNDDKSFFWVNDAGKQFVSDSIAVVEAGNYKLVVTAINGCTDSLSFFVPVDTLRPVIHLTQSKPFICDQQQIEIMAGVQSGGPDFDFEWSTIGGSFANNTQTLTPSVNSTGSYQLWVSNPSNGCASVQSLILVEEPNPIKNVEVFTTDPVCLHDANGYIEIVAIDGAFLPITLAVDGINVQGPRIEDLSSGDYHLSLTDSLGCKWDSLITLKMGREVGILLPADTTVTPGDEVLVIYNSLPTDQKWISTEWILLPGGGVVCNDCPSYVFVPNEDVGLVVLAKDSLGCLASDTILIMLNDAVALSFPNVFQPGSDGNNSTFYIPAQAGLAAIEFLKIYDNWGNLVFSKINMTPDMPEEGWNGMLNGCPLQPGVYVYQMRIRLNTGNTKLITKDLTLVR
jgi:gliding motility-associated-like protein